MFKIEINELENKKIFDFSKSPLINPKVFEKEEKFIH